MPAPPKARVRCASALKKKLKIRCQKVKLQQAMRQKAKNQFLSLCYLLPSSFKLLTFPLAPGRSDRWREKASAQLRH
jgi:hypothetical protein